MSSKWLCSSHDRGSFDIDGIGARIKACRKSVWTCERTLLRELRRFFTLFKTSGIICGLHIYTMVSDNVVVDRLCLLHDHNGSRQTI
jgi:hypothetical protein